MPVSNKMFDSFPAIWLPAHSSSLLGAYWVGARLSWPSEPKFDGKPWRNSKQGFGARRLGFVMPFYPCSKAKEFDSSILRAHAGPS